MSDGWTISFHAQFQGLTLAIDQDLSTLSVCTEKNGFIVHLLVRESRPSLLSFQ